MRGHCRAWCPRRMCPKAQVSAASSSRGGTPEAVAGAVVAGFRHIIYVASDDTEQTMMQLPLASEEAGRQVVYAGCSNNFHGGVHIGCPMKPLIDVEASSQEVKISHTPKSRGMSLPTLCSRTKACWQQRQWEFIKILS